MPSRIPVQHWNYDDLDDPLSPCRCVLCRKRRETAAVALALPVPEGHGSFRCKCAACRARRKADSAAIDAFNRHCTYSELTWAARGWPWTRRFLAWAWNRISNPTWRPAGPPRKATARWWWMYQVEQKTVGWWLECWLADDSRAASTASADRLLHGRASGPGALSKRSHDRLSCDGIGRAGKFGNVPEAVDD